MTAQPVKEYSSEEYALKVLDEIKARHDLEHSVVYAKPIHTGMTAEQIDKIMQHNHKVCRIAKTLHLNILVK